MRIELLRFSSRKPCTDFTQHLTIIESFAVFCYRKPPRPDSLIVQDVEEACHSLRFLYSTLKITAKVAKHGRHF